MKIMFSMRAVLLAVIVFGASAAGAAAQQLDTVKLAIGYIPNIQFTPLYVGIDKGFYREAGIDLKIEYGFGVDIFSLLSSGKIDIVSVYQYYQSYPVAIVAKKGVVDTPAQFAGTTIGTPEVYGSSYIGLELFLQHYNLVGKVKVQKIGYTQIPALMSGRVAGAVVFTTNEPVHLRELGVSFNEWDVKDFSDMVGSSFISSGQIVKDKGPLLSRFFAATSKAMSYIQQNPAEAVAIAMKYIDGADASQRPFLSASLAATMSLLTSPHGFGYIDPSLYTDSIKTLAAIGLIPSVYDASTILMPLGPSN